MTEQSFTIKIVDSSGNPMENITFDNHQEYLREFAKIRRRYAVFTEETTTKLVAERRLRRNQSPGQQELL